MFSSPATGTSVDIRQPPVLSAVASKFIAFDEPGKAVALFENAAKREVEPTPELLAIWCRCGADERERVGII